MAIDAGKIETLTARQRECLRLVAKNRGSGEIATILKIETETVNSHLKAAMAKLGASSRFAAANALADAENRPHSLVNPSLVTDTSPPGDEIETLYVQPDAEPDHVSVQEARAPFDAFGPVEEEAPASLPEGAIRNDLSARNRLILTAAFIALMFMGAFAAGAMVYTTQGVIMASNPDNFD